MLNLEPETRAGMYKAFNPADLVYCVFSYFSWNTPDMSSKQGENVAFNILANLIGAHDLLKGRTCTALLDFIHNHDDVSELRLTDCKEKLFGESSTRMFQQFCDALESRKEKLQVSDRS